VISQQGYPYSKRSPREYRIAIRAKLSPGVAEGALVRKYNGTATAASRSGDIYEIRELQAASRSAVFGAGYPGPSRDRRSPNRTA
jgi:hypothetical protein